MPSPAEELIAKTPKISSLPLIFYQVNEAVNDPESSFSDIANIISGDAGLSARLLKIVNSAFYGFPSRIETITHAITIIGTAQLRDLVLATTVMGKFRGISMNLISMNDFWRHSIACGLVARVIATFRQESNSDRYYVMGLLHDIGRLVMFMTVPEKCHELLGRVKDKAELLYKIEESHIGCDHSDVGRALLKAWNLSPRLEEAVGNHHHLDRESRYPVEPTVIHVADIIANAMRLGTSGESLILELQQGAWEELGLPPSKAPDIMEIVDQQFEEVIQMFL